MFFFPLYISQDLIEPILNPIKNKSSTKESSEVQSTTATAGNIKIVRLKLPMEDTQHWAIEESAGRVQEPYPHSDPIFNPEAIQSSQIHPNYAVVCPSEYTGRLIANWFTLMNFRKLFQLPLLSFESFDILLSDITNVHPVLRQIHISLLSILIKERFASAGSGSQQSSTSSKGQNAGASSSKQTSAVNPIRLNVGVSNHSHSGRIDNESDLGTFTDVFEAVSDNTELKELGKFFERYRDRDIEETHISHCFTGLDELFTSDSIDVEKIKSIMQGVWTYIIISTTIKT